MSRRVWVLVPWVATCLLMGGLGGPTPAFGDDPVASRAAQSATGHAAQEGTQSGPSPSTTASAAHDAPAEAPADEEPDIELLRQREYTTRTHRALGIATWFSLGATVALGTLVAIDRPTLFGAGQCSSASGFNVLGDFGCNGGLTAAHEVSALIALGMYTTTGVLAISMPDPEHVRAGHDARGGRARLHRGLAVIHLVGMILTPLLGIVSVMPNLVGVPPSAQSDFSATMRTVHLGVGYVTFAALTAAMLVEF